MGFTKQKCWKNFVQVYRGICLHYSSEVAKNSQCLHVVEKGSHVILLGSASVVKCMYNLTFLLFAAQESEF